MGELKRSLFTRRAFILLCSIVLMSLIVCYIEGSWKTYLNWYSSPELKNIDPNSQAALDVMHFHGNVFRLWNNAFETLKILLPIFLMLPYIDTYIEEKVTNYRYYVLSRKSHWRYLREKIGSILGSTTIVILGSQFITMGIIYLFSSHDISPKYLDVIVSSSLEDTFKNAPYLFWGMALIGQVIYMLTFCLFSLGVASFLKNKLYIYILPFIISTLSGIVLPAGYRLSSVFDVTLPDFSIIGYAVMNGILLILGISLLIYNEIKWRRG